MTNNQDEQIKLKSEVEVDLTVEDESPAFAWPTVVAVVVTHNPGDWLEECLESIEAQEYPDLTTLVVDVCSADDPSERVATSMPSAFVRRIEEDMNFAQAVNVAVNSIEGATYVLICHDDVILGPGAIAAMVEEAFRSNASIVGPKVTDAAKEGRLLEVGGMIDHFGVPFSGIEPDEVDQGQHDGVRDVFFVSSATMLVRADLFRALGGFDVECFPGAEDIDLAWRAHLVGARVLVQPDAVIKHHKTSDRQRKSRTSATAIVARHRMRAVLKNSSAVSLAWILPVSFILHSIEGLVWLLRLDPKRAWLLFSGWIWNIRHLSDTRKERSKIQKTREVSDRDISTHQIGGSARIRRFFTSLIHSRQLQKFTDASKTFATTRYSNRTRETPIYLSAMLVYFIAVRSLIFNGIAVVGDFTKWPSFSQQVSAILHGGLPVSSEPMLASTLGRVVALFATTLFLGKEGIAQTAFTLSLIPIGGFGVRMLLRERAMGPRSVAIASITYGTFALMMFAFSIGNFGSIVILAGLPYFVRALSNRKSRQAGISAGLMIAFSPSAIIVCAVISGIYIAIGERSASDGKPTSLMQDYNGRTKAALMAIVIAAVLNVGLLVDSIRNIDRNTFGLNVSIDNMTDYFFSNINVTIATYVGIAICACALIVGRHERTSELRVLVVSTSILAAFAMMSIQFAQPIFDVSTLYVVLQLCVAIGVGVGIHSFADEMKLRSFGVFHFATIFSIAGVLLSLLLSLPVLVDGSFGLPQRSWSNQIEAIENERVLYVGDARAVPGRQVLAPYNRSFNISLGTSPSLSQSFAGPASSLDQDVRNVYSAVMNGETVHSGELFARMGIGTIVIPNSIAPDVDKFEIDQQLVNAFSNQVDLVRLRDRDGLIVFDNSSFKKSLEPTQYANPISPADYFKSRSNDSNALNAKENESTSPIAILAAISSTLFFAAVVLWRRRHQLISTRSLTISRIVSKSQQESEVAKSSISVDLEEEHAQDEINKKGEQTTVDADDSTQEVVK